MYIKQPAVEIDTSYMRELGYKLREAREKRMLTARELADCLLFSASQIERLEEGNAEGFYGGKLFLQAQRKYCAFLKAIFKK